MELPTKSRAAILTQTRSALVIDEITLPKKLAVGQVLVKVHYSGICGSQIGEINAVKGPDKYLPHLLGHEGCASVLAVGAGVNHVKPNDITVMHWRKGAGIEANPATYRWRDKPLNAGQITTFNEYAVVSENRLTVIPTTFNKKLAPLLGCAVTTGFGVVNNDAQLRPGQSIAVFGAGGIGLNIIQAAAMVNAYPIIAIDQYAHKLALARQLGATDVIDVSDPVFTDSRSKGYAEKLINKLTLGEMLDVAVDNTGNTQVIENCYQLTHGQGRVILVGVPNKDNNINIHSLPLHFGKTLTGSHGGACQPAQDIPRLVKLYNAKKLELASLITSEFSLNDINTAIKQMTEGKISGRCLIHFF